MPAPPSFTRHGAELPETPVILSVPHAGRDYPLPLRAGVRVPIAALRPLEDRHVDALALAARGRETLFIAQRARAWIDLNRSESERDPLLDEGARPGGAPMSAKLRSGLGLVPRRAGKAGNIWQNRLSDAEVVARIHADHRPYHAALAQALAAAKARFGIALLLDIHSMPSLARTGPGPRPQIVLGDRFGKSASSRLVARLDATIRGFGIACATNAPYAGGHILDRHGDPRGGVHAIQIEFDRALYLDESGDSPGPGLPRMAALLRALIEAAEDEAVPLPIAAE